MNIYSSVDNTNIDKIICLFYTVYVNTNKKEDLNFYILTDEIPTNLPYIPDCLANITTIKKVIFNDEWSKLLDDFNKNFYKLAHWCKSNMNFARFLFFETFPEVERVLYLDWDMVVQADIFEIEYEYNQLDKMVFATSDKKVFSPNIFTNQFKNRIDYNDLLKGGVNKNIDKIFKILKVSRKQKNIEGFNAGFYIISKQHFNQSQLISLITNLVKIQSTLDCFNFGTQVVMNFMNLDERIYLSKIWNHLPKLEVIDTLKIIHYNGTQKPWDDYKKPENKKWFDFYDELYPEWKTTKIDTKKINNQISKQTKEKPNIKKNKIKNSDLFLMLKR